MNIGMYLMFIIELINTTLILFIVLFWTFHRITCICLFFLDNALSPFIYILSGFRVIN